MKLHGRKYLKSLSLCFIITVLSIGLALAGIKGFGTEDRDWVTGPEIPNVSLPIYDIIEENDVMVTMRDGVQLQVNIYHPDLPEGAGPPPGILCTTGYGIDFYSFYFIPSLIDLAKRGYVVVYASLRGSGLSEGVNNLYNQYGKDGYDLVEWMANQPWCNGNIGMVGSSLLGISQWLAAKENPPHLKAINPHIACGDCYDILWYPGGMLPGPGRVARGAPEYPSAIEHRNFDEWWRERVSIKEDHKKIASNGIAVLMTGGWNDYISPGNIRAFEEFIGPRKMLIVGPWAHGAGTGIEPYDYASYQTLWFDYYLKGIDNGIQKEPKALIYVQGPDQWRFEHAWPIPDTHPLRLYLRSTESGTIDSINDGSLSKKKSTKNDPEVSIDYSPVDGPFLETMLSSSLGRISEDKQTEEQSCLTWTSGIFEEATEISGWIKLKFWAAIAASDTDFVVQIADVAPDGKSTQVTCGYLNAPRYFDNTYPEIILPGEIYKYKLKVLPTSYVIQPGHRIRVDLAGGSIAAEGQPGPQGPGLNPNESTITIFQDKRHPSQVELPIIGSGWKYLAN